MKKSIIQKLFKALGDSVTWWVEDDTLYLEGMTGLKTELYESDLNLNFNLALNIALSEVEDNYLRPLPIEVLMEVC